MEEHIKKSLELEQRFNELREEFQRGVEEKERLLGDLGITAERLAAFEAKLSPEARNAMEAMRENMESEWERAAASPGPATKSAPKVKGMRI